MSVYIVDASVAAKWFTEEDHAQAALRLIQGGDPLHVPDFFLLEMDNLICKWIRQGMISEPEGENLRATLKTLPLNLHSIANLQDSAFLIANQTRRSVYDCLYIALAVALNGQMVTADRRLFEGLKDGPFAGRVVWIEDLV